MLPSLSFLGGATSPQSEISDIGVKSVPVTGGGVTKKRPSTGKHKPRRGYLYGPDAALGLGSRDEESYESYTVKDVVGTDDTLNLEARLSTVIGTITISYHEDHTPWWQLLFDNSTKRTYTVSVIQNPKTEDYRLYFTQTGEIYKKWDVTVRPMWGEIKKHLLSDLMTIDGTWRLAGKPKMTYKPNLTEPFWLEKVFDTIERDES